MSCVDVAAVTVDVAVVDVGTSVVAVDVGTSVVAAVSCVNIVWFSSNAVCD